MSPPFGIQRGLESDAVVELYAIAGEDFLMIVHHTVRKAGKAVAQGSDMGIHGPDAKIVTLFKEIVQTHLKIPLIAHLGRAEMLAHKIEEVVVYQKATCDADFQLQLVG
jgi:hypothetical protein